VLWCRGAGFARCWPTAAWAHGRARCFCGKPAAATGQCVNVAIGRVWLSESNQVGGSGRQRNKGFDYSEKNFYSTQNSIEKTGKILIRLKKYEFFSRDRVEHLEQLLY
jgi:hypothetical protein